jgi:hypothetical protein
MGFVIEWTEKGGDEGRLEFADDAEDAARAAETELWSRPNVDGASVVLTKV